MECEHADGIYVWFEMLLAWPGFAASLALPFSLCLGKIHRNTLASKGSRCIWVHSGCITASQGGNSGCLHLLCRGIARTGCEVLV